MQNPRGENKPDVFKKAVVAGTEWIREMCSARWSGPDCKDSGFYSKMKASEGSDQGSTVIWLPFKEIAILAAVCILGRKTRVC